jgi:putative oxidoreductase
MIALIFVISAVIKIVAFSGTAAAMAKKGIPMTELLLVISIVVELSGALMIIVGWKARLGAAALFLWMIPVSLLYHNFWAMEGQEQFINRIMFLKNISMMGAMLFLMTFGSGGFSVDARAGKSRSR